MELALDATVRDVLASGRLGVPVFVRWMAQAPCGELRVALARLLATAGVWLQAEPLRIWVQEGRPGVHIAAQVLYAGGQTALVNLVAGEGPPRADLMLLGSRGALYHDSGPLAGRVTAAPRGPVADRLEAAIERSLRRGAPVAWEGGGRDE